MRGEGMLTAQSPTGDVCLAFQLNPQKLVPYNLLFLILCFLKMFICLKRFLRKIVEQRNLYTYLHRPVLEISAEDLKAQFKWGRAKAQVSYEEDALAFDVQLSKSPRLLLLRRLLPLQ